MGAEAPGTFWGEWLERVREEKGPELPLGSALSPGAWNLGPSLSPSPPPHDPQHLREVEESRSDREGSESEVSQVSEEQQPGMSVPG